MVHVLFAWILEMATAIKMLVKVEKVTFNLI